jgi:hypothetical protein
LMGPGNAGPEHMYSHFGSNLPAGMYSVQASVPGFTELDPVPGFAERVEAWLTSGTVILDEVMGQLASPACRPRHGKTPRGPSRLRNYTQPSASIGSAVGECESPRPLPSAAEGPQGGRASVRRTGSHCHPDDGKHAPREATAPPPHPPGGTRADGVEVLAAIPALPAADAASEARLEISDGQAVLLTKY